MVKSDQSIKGDNNLMAGRDINTTNNYTNSTTPLVFNEQNFAEILNNFSNLHQKEDSKSLQDDFERISIENKNKINTLTDDYFKHMQETSLPYFRKIQTFLTDSINQESVKKYTNIVAELQDTIIAQRGEYSVFEKIFDAIAGKLQENYKQINIRLVKTLLHYMYWNCDIGKKDDQAT